MKTEVGIAISVNEPESLMEKNQTLSRSRAESKEVIKSQVEQAKTLTNYHKLHNN